MSCVVNEKEAKWVQSLYPSLLSVASVCTLSMVFPSPHFGQPSWLSRLLAVLSWVWLVAMGVHVFYPSDALLAWLCMGSASALICSLCWSRPRKLESFLRPVLTALIVALLMTHAGRLTTLLPVHGQWALWAGAVSLSAIVCAFTDTLRERALCASLCCLPPLGAVVPLVWTHQAEPLSVGDWLAFANVFWITLSVAYVVEVATVLWYSVQQRRGSGGKVHTV